MPLWTWCLFRIGYVRGSRGQRELWTVLLLLACGATLRLSYVERGVTGWTGVGDSYPNSTNFQ